MTTRIGADCLRGTQAGFILVYGCPLHCATSFAAVGDVMAMFDVCGKVIQMSSSLLALLTVQATVVIALANHLFCVLVLACFSFQGVVIPTSLSSTKFVSVNEQQQNCL